MKEAECNPLAIRGFLILSKKENECHAVRIMSPSLPESSFFNESNINIISIKNI